MAREGQLPAWRKQRHKHVLAGIALILCVHVLLLGKIDGFSGEY